MPARDAHLRMSVAMGTSIPHRGCERTGVLHGARCTWNPHGPRWIHAEPTIDCTMVTPCIHDGAMVDPLWAPPRKQVRPSGGRLWNPHWSLEHSPHGSPWRPAGMESARIVERTLSHKMGRPDADVTIFVQILDASMPTYGSAYRAGEEWRQPTRVCRWHMALSMYNLYNRTLYPQPSLALNPRIATAFQPA